MRDKWRAAWSTRQWAKAGVATVLLGALCVLVACTGARGAAGGETPEAPPEPVTRVITVGASSMAHDSAVTYTCPNEDYVLEECSPKDPWYTNGVWTKHVTVPVDSTIRVQVHGGLMGGTCWIANEQGGITYDRNETGGACAYTVE